ncbi:MAG: hypothetical protein WA417_10825 [Stellaceae bacterium]|jgi:hypothetical protein
MRRALLRSVSAVALTAGAVLCLGAGRIRRGAQRGRREGLPATANNKLKPLDNTALTRQFLLYYIVPLWLAAGVSDWVCHRVTKIEKTTGAKESLLHLLMLAEVSVPVVAALFLEITTPVAALMILIFLLHEATALWDVSYAVTRREVTPIEQHVHSFLEMVPLMAISFVAVLHWPQFSALLGQGEEPPDLSIRAKDRPLPPRYVAAALGATIIFELLPYLEELSRTLRASHGRLVPPPDAKEGR